MNPSLGLGELTVSSSVAEMFNNHNTVDSITKKFAISLHLHKGPINSLGTTPKPQTTNLVGTLLHSLLLAI